MPFFDAGPGRGTFMVHFTFPDFRIWALAYTHSARTLKRSLLARYRFSDYEAYPLVFLYRHALELHLKNLIVRAVDLSSLVGDEPLMDRLRATHRLPVLLSLARRLLASHYPNDDFIAGTLRSLDGVVADLDAIDPDSMTFRYPVNRSGHLPSEPLTLSVRTLAAGLDRLLDDLD